MVLALIWLVFMQSTQADVHQQKKEKYLWMISMLWLMMEKQYVR